MDKEGSRWINKKQDQQNGKESGNKGDLTHVSKLLVNMLVWLKLFMLMSTMCLCRCPQRLAMPVMCVFVCVYVWALWEVTSLQTVWKQKS